MAWPQILAGLVVAIVFAKHMVDRTALRLNPMLVGRLFLMLAFADAIQEWLPPGAEIDALSSATPLGLMQAEGVAYSRAALVAGRIAGDWEGIYAIVPGSPGDVLPWLTLLCGVGLYAAGILDWRPGVTFVLGFAATCPLLGMPVLFHLLAGSIAFTAVYIVTDPRSLPGSGFGRLAAGFLAGVLNAVVRRQGYYPEGIVVAVLAVNLLGPSLDRLAFHARGWRLRRAARRH
jgi:Na+-translocating ferredoxin:NAD+ oxidoreductase RnfD subunit